MRLPAIDGLRAIAMTMVIAFHCGLFPIGWTGVWLFYVISGFVITRNFLAERATGIPRGAHWASFAIRRFFRIVPPYALYIAICSALILFLRDPSGLHGLGFLATFTANWWFLDPNVSKAYFGFLPLWTISVEEQFYLVFPILFFFVAARRLPALLVALFAWGPVWRWLFEQGLGQFGIAHPDVVASAVYTSSLGQFDAFILGALLAHVEGYIRRPRIALCIGAVAMAALFSYWIAFHSIIEHLRAAHLWADDRLFTGGPPFGRGRELVLYTAIDLCAAALIALALSGSSALSLLATKPLAWIGRNSYSGYLYHALALQMFGTLIWRHDPRDFPSPHAPLYLIRLAAFTLTFIASIAAAYISYSVIEKRSLKLGHELARRLALARSRRNPLVET